MASLFYVKRTFKSFEIKFLASIFLVLAFLWMVFALAEPRVPDANLEKFINLTSADPLFYDPAMDVGFLRSSVAEMRKRDDLILYVDSLYRSNAPKKYQNVFPEGWRLWPDDFLGTLPDIHETTSDFLASPSEEKAARLLELYRKAAMEYRKAIELHIKALDRILTKDPKAAETTIVFLGSGTNPEIVRNDFLLIRKNALALEKEIRARRLCLYIGRCDLKPPVELPEEEGVFVPFDPLPPEILGLDPTKKNFAGPYWVTTGCFGFAENGRPFRHPFYVKILPSKDGSRPFLIPALANERFYRDYTKTPNSATGIINLKAGIKFRPQTESADYLCTDLNYLPKVLSQYLFSEEENARLAALPYLIQNSLRVSFPLIYYPFYTEVSRLPLEFLITRNSYSVYFGTFSSKIWRLNRKPRFLLRGNIDFRPGYTDYYDLKKGGLSDETLAEPEKLLELKQIYREATFGADL